MERSNSRELVIVVRIVVPVVTERVKILLVLPLRGKTLQAPVRRDVIVDLAVRHYCRPERILPDILMEVAVADSQTDRRQIGVLRGLVVEFLLELIRTSGSRQPPLEKISRDLSGFALVLSAPRAGMSLTSTESWLAMDNLPSRLDRPAESWGPLPIVSPTEIALELGYLIDLIQGGIEVEPEASPAPIIILTDQASDQITLLVHLPKKPRLITIHVTLLLEWIASDNRG